MEPLALNKVGKAVINKDVSTAVIMLAILRYHASDDNRTSDNQYSNTLREISSKVKEFSGINNLLVEYFLTFGKHGTPMLQSYIKGMVISSANNYTQEDRKRLAELEDSITKKYEEIRVMLKK